MSKRRQVIPLCEKWITSLVKSKGWRCAVERVIADENKRIGTASLVKGLDIDGSKVRMHVRKNGSKLNRVFGDFLFRFQGRVAYDTDTHI